MGSSFLKILFLLLPLHLFAIANGNPGEPFLLNTGILRSEPSSWSLRVGYMGDYVYNQRFRELPGCTPMETHLKLYTNAGIATFSIRDRFDFYTILGASRLQIDEEAFSKTRFGWGIGGKVVIVRMGRFCLGADLKYFESDQKPLFFVCDSQAFNITSDYELNYSEAQGSLGITYRTNYVAPYVNVSYIASKIDPNPAVPFVRLPTEDIEIRLPTESGINLYRWGLALGATLVDKRKSTLSVEWRAINQNSIDINGELRF